MDELEEKLRPWYATAFFLAGIAIALILYISLALFLGK